MIVKLPSGSFIDLSKYAYIKKTSTVITLVGANGTTSVNFTLTDPDAVKILSNLNEITGG